MAIIRSFRDLDVYKLGRQRATRIFLLSKAFPKEERYSLTDQIRRSSRAVNAMVAEAWARRLYSAAFINKIDEAWERQWKPKLGWITPSTVITSRERNTMNLMMRGRRLARC